MNKLESLELLKEWGFNVPRFLGNPQLLPIGDVKAYFKGIDRFGIRTCLKKSSIENFDCPLYVDLSFEEAMETISSIFEKYHTILYECIPSELAEISGHIELDENLSGTCEIFRGPGIVREVMQRKNIESFEFLRINSIQDEIIRSIAHRIKDIAILSGFKRTIIEFCINSIPVGIKKEPLILWEFRDGF